VFLFGYRPRSIVGSGYSRSISAGGSWRPYLLVFRVWLIRSLTPPKTELPATIANRRPKVEKYPPIAREPRLSRFLRFPGPFPPIAREPRPSRFLLARSLPLRGNPGFPAFPVFLARSLPLRGNPGLPAFSVFLARSLPLRRNAGHPGPFHPPFPPTGAGRARSVQVRPERQKSQQSPGPTGTTVNTSRALLRPPPGALLQVTDTVPERFRRHQVPTPLFVHSLNKGPPLLRHLFVLLPLFRALTADPRTPYAPQKLPRPCGVPPQPQKGTGARGIPRPIRMASNPVTSLPPVNVTSFLIMIGLRFVIETTCL
jgi:hypothetical protein